MKRTLLMLVAAMLTMAAVAAAQTQDQYQSGAQSSGAVNQQSTTPAQTPTTPTDQSTTSADPSAATTSELPKTASPLPLMGMGGLASVAAGLWLTRPRRRA